jgi:hypothetical protein
MSLSTMIYSWWLTLWISRSSRLSLSKMFIEIEYTYAYLRLSKKIEINKKLFKKTTAMSNEALLRPETVSKPTITILTGLASHPYVHVEKGALSRYGLWCDHRSRSMSLMQFCWHLLDACSVWIVLAGRRSNYPIADLHKPFGESFRKLAGRKHSDIQ